LMTGSWPHTHGVVRNGFVVNQGNVMLAEVLREAGMHTAAFLGSFALERRFAFHQGFDYYDEEFDQLVTPDGNYDQNQRLAENVTAAALRHVDRLEKGERERLFLFVHYFDPHAPYGAPLPEAGPPTSMQDVEAAVRLRQRALIGQEIGHAGSINGGFLGAARALVGRGGGEPLDADRRLAEAYAGEVAYLDHCLGQLLSGLEERGILDEAVVVVTADHGETFWEHHDFWNHGLWVHQTTVHVPLLIALPDGRGAGLEIDTPVSTIDVLPTLCHLLDLELPERAEGVTLVPALDGEPHARGPVFCEATQPWKMARGEGRAWANSRLPQAARMGPWKFVRSRYNSVEQLFHLEQDPGETDNLLASRPADPALQERVRQMRALLTEWTRGADPLPSHFDSSQMAETLQRLKGMGYSGDEDSSPGEGR